MPDSASARKPVSAGARLRAAIAAEQPLQIVGTVNAYLARMAQRVGFKALYLSGGALSAGSLGLPDLGISNLADLLTDVQRIGVLLQLAREEAIVRNRPTAFEANQNSYHFLVRNDNRWELINDLDMLREREFSLSPITFAMTPVTRSDTDSLRIVFGREPVDKPFVLDLTAGEDHVSIRADGVGHFVVE